MSDRMNPGDEILQELYEWNKEKLDNKAYGEIPVVSDILYAIAGLFTGLFGLLISGLTKLTAFLLEALYKALSSIILAPINSVLGSAIDFFVEQGFIDKQIKDILETIIQSTGEYDQMVAVIFYFFSLTNVVSAIMEVSNVKTQQNILEKMKPMLPTPEQLIRLLYIKPNDEDFNRSLLMKYGYDHDMITKMKSSNQAILNEGQLQIMYYRKLIGITQVFDELRKNGYSDNDVEKILESWEIIPSIRDLLYLVAKEAFEPDQINAYGLLAEFPEEQREWLNKQGMSDYWIGKWWAGHWSYPSPQQVLEMLHRKKITKNDVYQYYRVVEMPPYWRDKLMEVSYRPYSRVDIRRMHLLGVVGDEKLHQAYTDIGYDDEHAENMVKFTKLYNEKGKNDLTRAQILRFLKLGIISKSNAYELLSEIGYDKVIIDYYLRDVEIQVQKEYIKEVIDVVEYQYINRMVTQTYVRSRLTQIGISTEKIDVYLGKWDVSREKARKIPSKEDLVKFYSTKIINKFKFTEYMSLLGYEDENINWYIEYISKTNK